MAGFELSCGSSGIAWRSDARYGGAEVVPTGDAGAWPTPKITTIDAGT